MGLITLPKIDTKSPNAVEQIKEALGLIYNAVNGNLDQENLLPEVDSVLTGKNADDKHSHSLIKGSNDGIVAGVDSDGNFKVDSDLTVEGDTNLNGDVTVATGKEVITEVVKALNANGLKLTDDSGNIGVFIKDGGDVTNDYYTRLGSTSDHPFFRLKELEVTLPTIAGAASTTSTAHGLTLSKIFHASGNVLDSSGVNLFAQGDSNPALKFNVYCDATNINCRIYATEGTGLTQGTCKFTIMYTE